MNSKSHGLYKEKEISWRPNLKFMVMLTQRVTGGSRWRTMQMTTIHVGYAGLKLESQETL